MLEQFGDEWREYEEFRKLFTKIVKFIIFGVKICI